MKHRHNIAGSIALTVALVLCMGSVAHATSFRPLGTRAMSMGGAGVARPEGAFAVYYNPAALAANSEHNIQVAFAGGFSIRETGLAEHLDDLVGLDWEEAIDNPLSPDALFIVTELLTVKPDEGIILSPVPSKITALVPTLPVVHSEPGVKLYKVPSKPLILSAAVVPVFSSIRQWANAKLGPSG